MAPRFRSRITTGLLVAAAVLPVPLAATAATASAEWATPVDRPPDLVRPQGSRPHVPPDTYAADPRLAGSLAGAGRGHPGRPDSMAHTPQRPGSDVLAERPDHMPSLPENREGFSYRPPHVPGDPPAHRQPRHPRDHSGPDATAPSSSASAPASGAPSTDFPDSPDLTGVPDMDGAEIPPSSSAPSPPVSDEAAPPAQPSPEERRDLAGGSAQRPYEPLPPLQSPSTPAQQPGSALGTTDNEPATTASPYAMEAPVSRVERVLPLGAGLAFTGLGLAFFGLRLRRR
ncbi:hypothetical protein AB0I10_10945 [Streptomyces sp. NPDC050636]|uniref:hypothetical protein n=1 Tax=Streptomyces sp. NPDC050636 TaxID=3154510 RepID=UPI00343ADFA0